MDIDRFQANLWNPFWFGFVPVCKQFGETLRITLMPLRFDLKRIWSHHGFAWVTIWDPFKLFFGKL